MLQTAGAITSIGTWNSTKPEFVFVRSGFASGISTEHHSMTAVSSSRISAVHPLWAVEDGRVTIEGSDLPVEPALPRVTIGGVAARLTAASSTELTAIVPSGLEGGHTAI